jgi:hypothetical protein
MKREIVIIALVAAVHISPGHRFADAGQTRTADPNVQEVINKFAAAESQNKIARNTMLSCRTSRCKQ